MSGFNIHSGLPMMHGGITGHGLNSSDIMRLAGYANTAHNMIRYCTGTTTKFDMVYKPTSKNFKASDFSIIGDIPEPVVTTRPKLL
jgi:hypothetical protein